MKLAASRPTTHSERIYAIEEARKVDAQRLDKIETMVSDMHAILVNARGFKWVLDGIFKYSGQIAIFCGSAYAAWKFFH